MATTVVTERRKVEKEEEEEEEEGRRWEEREEALQRRTVSRSLEVLLGRLTPTMDLNSLILLFAFATSPSHTFTPLTLFNGILYSPLGSDQRRMESPLPQPTSRRITSEEDDVEEGKQRDARDAAAWT